ncbi:peptide-methionine (S)-S-oxide reductase [Sediminitomix flava]|uniref:Peptide methionine sulfoxide reductase MsrA n=2 Tax=Sediminitomix flava TaxID=379075 RepID=A0A315Z725_SEDFL|nr:peptide-methionine (S)-S-oxide reductase [Sediminitomix flava]
MQLRLRIIITIFLSIGFVNFSFSQKNKKMDMEENLEMITLGAGCFWCVEAVFQDLIGVEKVESGYSNGQGKNPTYKEVCSGTTGYAEVAQITFDPTVISLEQLLEVFWYTHNPTTLNQQGADKGTQYRSGIFYANEEQKNIAEQSKAKVEKSGLWSDPIVTEITPLKDYYPAENYHQNYYNNNSQQPYCQIVIAPKLKKLYSEYKHLLKSQN